MSRLVKGGDCTAIVYNHTIVFSALFFVGKTFVQEYMAVYN
jgi:hypothetical protein